jgi:hypothetical protein
MGVERVEDVIVGGGLDLVLDKTGLRAITATAFEEDMMRRINDGVSEY